MTKTSTDDQVETTTVTVPVPVQVTYERIQYVVMRDEDYHVTVDGVYLGIVGNCPGERFWTVTLAGSGIGQHGRCRTREAATRELILADGESRSHC